MKVKTLASIITLSIIVITMSQASIQNKLPEIESTSCCDMEISCCDETAAAIYQSMTTAQLQTEVEKHINNKSLSFILGKELIKRWTKS